MKILIIRFSSIGDIVLTSPVIRCVKTQIPDSEVHFLTKSSFNTLVANNPYLDKVHLYSKEDHLSSIIESLKNENYDLVIDLHKNLRTRRIISALRVKKYSFKKLTILKWLFVNFKINLLPNIHIVDRYFKGIKGLGVINDEKGIDYFLEDDSSDILIKHNLQKSDYTVLVVGGTYHTKQIPEDVILRIIKRLNSKLVLLGAGKSDESKAQRITQAADNPLVINLCGKLSLDQSAQLLKYANNTITSDTGLMHIASAYNNPIHTIWGNTHTSFGMYADRTNAKTYEYQVPLKCNPCSKLGSDKCPKGHHKCMTEQNVVQIVKNCSVIEPAQ